MHELDHDDLINNVDHNEKDRDHKFDALEFSNPAQMPLSKHRSNELQFPCDIG